MDPLSQPPLESLPTLTIELRPLPIESETRVSTGPAVNDLDSGCAIAQDSVPETSPPTWIALRYWQDQPHQCEEQRLAIADISDLLSLSSSDYESLMYDTAGIGQDLYRWLNGKPIPPSMPLPESPARIAYQPDGWLDQALAAHRGEPVLVAISTPDAALARLPWETLHDGRAFLVESNVVPICL
jgi:hypothetical protein